MVLHTLTCDFSVLLTECRMGLLSIHLRFTEGWVESASSSEELSSVLVDIVVVTVEEGKRLFNN